jgi:hypothetical protein
MTTNGCKTSPCGTVTVGALREAPRFRAVPEPRRTTSGSLILADEVLQPALVKFLRPERDIAVGFPHLILEVNDLVQDLDEFVEAGPSFRVTVAHDPMVLEPQLIELLGHGSAALLSGNPTGKRNAEQKNGHKPHSGFLDPFGLPFTRSPDVSGVFTA